MSWSRSAISCTRSGTHVSVLSAAFPPFVQPGPYPAVSPIGVGGRVGDQNGDATTAQDALDTASEHGSPFAGALDGSPVSAAPGGTHDDAGRLGREGLGEDAVGGPTLAQRTRRLDSGTAGAIDSLVERPAALGLRRRQSVLDRQRSRRIERA